MVVDLFSEHKIHCSFSQLCLSVYPSDGLCLCWFLLNTCLLGFKEGATKAWIYFHWEAVASMAFIWLSAGPVKKLIVCCRHHGSDLLLLVNDTL